MPLLQLQIDDKLKKAIKEKSATYNVPASSLIKIVLTKAFIAELTPYKEGNVFNAQRDNNGQGISIDSLIEML